MKKEINTLFALFRCAVFGDDLCDDAKKEAAEKASLLYDMARHHDLAHLLDCAYKKQGIEIPDENISFKLLKQQALSVVRYENLNLALENISGLFEKEKIAFVPLKGAVIRNIYPEPWMRTSCDIDILVHEDEIERALQVLIEKLGYTVKGERNYHDISLYSDTGVHLELHFNIKENMENIDRLLEKVWDYATPKEEGSYEYVLTNEFLLFQHVAHMSYHVVGGGCSVRYFMDLFLLENKLEFDKTIFGKMLEECGLVKFYKAVSKLARVWFADESHDDVTLSLQKYILFGGIYGTKVNSIAMNDEKKSTVAYVADRVFMPYEKLCITYPGLKGKKILLPFYQVKRWCRTLKNHRYASASEELKANRGVSEDRIHEFSGLLTELELNKTAKK